MRIIIDNSNLFAGGGIQVATSFLNDLSTISTDFEFFVVQSYTISKQIDKNKFDKKFHFFDLDEPTSKSILKKSKVLKQIEDRIAPACVFTVFGPSYYKSKCLKVVGFARGHMLYMDSPYFRKQSLVSNLKQHIKNYIHRHYFIKNSNALIFETEDAKFRFSEFSNIKSYHVSNTINSIFQDSSKWCDVELKHDKSFMILYVGANYEHKNLSILPEIANGLLKLGVDNFKFVLTLSKDELKIHPSIAQFFEFVGKVKVEQLPNLYSKCDTVVCPSLLEIFSATYLEAMFMGKPIISSDMTFARGICENAAIYCDPNNPMAYASSIKKLIDTPELGIELVNKGVNIIRKFGTSKQRTQAYLEIIKETILNNENKR